MISKTFTNFWFWDDFRLPIKVLLISWALIFGIHMSAISQVQKRMTTGTIADVGGIPLPGVNVVIKGTNTGSTTDRDGKYSLEVLEESAVLIFSFIGFATQEVAVSGRSVIDVALQEEISQLGEVVVMGYGELKKESVIGSVTSVGTKQLQDRAVVSFGEAIAGQLPGVQVQQTSSAPGAGLSIKIRGVGSISADNTPLYVIDGVPLDNSAGSRGAQGVNDAFPNAPANPLAWINPADIQTIDVLKDASATAIYGSRGSNGVVIITTKQGVKGKTQINFSVTTGLQSIAHTIPMLTTAEYVQRQIDIRNYNYTNTNGVPNGKSASDPNSVRGSNANLKIPNEFKDQSSLANTDWQKAVYGTAAMRNYQLSASGGTENARFYISANYVDQQAITKGNGGFKKYSFRGNIDATITDKIQMGFRIAPSYSVNNLSASGGLSFYGGASTAALTAPPIFPIYNPDGTYFTIRTVTFDDASPPQILGTPNGVALSREFENVLSQFNTVATFFTTIDFTDNLTFKTSINGDITAINTDQFVPSTIRVAGSNLYGSSFKGLNLNWINENTLTYDNTFNGVHHVNALVGFSEQMSTFSSLSISAEDYPNDLVHTVNAGITSGTGADKSQWTIASFLSRLNYDFNGKYLLTATFRRDGSSRFGADTKWGSFPSAAIGWRVSKESFMEALPVVSNLKVRASYGVVGNNQIGNYRAIGAIGSTSYSLGTGDGNIVGGLTQNSLANSGLTWEKSNSVDIGVDLGLFKDKIFITADYYDKVSSGMLFDVPVPTFTGFSQTTRNLGRLRNKGFELGIDTRNMERGDFVWTSNFNISSNKNVVEKLNATDDDIFSVNYGVVNAITHRTRVGEAIGSYYGYIYDGVFKNAAELAAGPKFASGTVVGDPKLRDISGADGKPDGVINNFDKTNLGNNLPKVIYGITNSVSYKNFDLTFLLQGVRGVKVMNLLKTSGNYKQVTALFKDYWKSEAEPGDGQTFRPGYAAYQGNNPIITSWLIEDASFLRVKNITLGYRFQKLFGGKVIKNARIYVNVQNLYTFTKYEGYNPEVNTVEGTDNTTPGMDFGTYPLTRTITFGLNMTF